MSQFLRPDGTTISTRIQSGDHNSINQVSSNNSPHILTLGLSAPQPAQYECTLSNPAGVPGAGISTVRWRARETADGVFGKISLMQGAAVLDQSTQGLPLALWLTFEWQPDTSGVTDWNDLLFRFDFTVLSGSGQQARLSWVEMEVPDPVAGNNAWFEFFD